jgi:hypothetical protein
MGAERVTLPTVERALDQERGVLSRDVTLVSSWHDDDVLVVTYDCLVILGDIAQQQRRFAVWTSAGEHAVTGGIIKARTIRTTPTPKDP